MRGFIERALNKLDKLDSTQIRTLIHDLASRAATAPLDALGGCALAGDLAAFRHETQGTRIFRT